MSDPGIRHCDRALAPDEATLLTALLTRARADARLIAQIPGLRVVAESGSAWPILDFSAPGGGEVVADFFWSEGPARFGVHVLAIGGAITCMECWSVDGRKDPSRWPSPDELRTSASC